MVASKTINAPRRGLSETEAAIYVGIGATKFRELVDKGELPKPRVIGTRRIFDIVLLDAAIDNIPIEGGDIIDTWGDLNGNLKAKAR